MNKKILITITSILVLAIVAGGFWYVQKYVQENNEQLIRVFEERQEEQNFEEIDTSDWKTYRNDYYGYQISYPKDWNVYEHNDADLPFLQSLKKCLLDFLSIFIIISPDYPRSTFETVKPYITPERENTSHFNFVSVDVGLVPMSCGRDKTVSGQLPKTVSEAFHNIFTLKKGENRESLQYNKQSSCFIYDDIPRCSYHFVHDPIYFHKESCYRLEIKDSTEDRKYLKTEEVILKSLQVIKKLN